MKGTKMVKVNTNFPEGIDMLVVEASREYVEAGNIVPVLKILNTMIEPDNIKKFSDRMMFCISGFDNDPRELAEISEVRIFMKKLDSEWPYWFFFASPYCLTLKFLAFTLSDIKQDSLGQMFMAGSDLSKFLKTHFMSVNIMEDKGWISQADSIRVTNKIEKYFMDNTRPIIF